MIRILLISLSLILVACSPQSPATPPTTEPITSPQQEIIEEQAPENVETTPESEIAAPAAEEESPVIAEINRPAWQTVQLINARTGETFTLADFEGKTVFVEPMATWCTNCRAQLGRVRQVRDQLGEENYAFVALSLETNLSSEALARYADNQGFDWYFAVMTNELLGLLADEFGRTITAAPSTPHFVIRPDGTFTDLSTGSKSVNDIAQELINESNLS